MREGDQQWLVLWGLGMERSREGKVGEGDDNEEGGDRGTGWERRRKKSEGGRRRLGVKEIGLGFLFFFLSKLPSLFVC
jgi:hypothetical protein